jgi:hypothetical protein
MGTPGPDREEEPTPRRVQMQADALTNASSEASNSRTGTGGQGSLLNSLSGTERQFRLVACGMYHTVALCESGAVFSWGSNDCGQLGLGKVIFHALVNSTSFFRSSFFLVHEVQLCIITRRYIERAGPIFRSFSRTATPLDDLFLISHTCLVNASPVWTFMCLEACPRRCTRHRVCLLLSSWRCLLGRCR